MKKEIIALGLASVLAIGWSTDGQAQTTFRINSLGDFPQSPLADAGVCWTGQLLPGPVGECTLRAAIEAANQRSEPVILDFSDIPVGSNDFSRIVIGSALPTITKRIEIRGQTHPLWSPGRTNVWVAGSTTGEIRPYSAFTFAAGSDDSRLESIGISTLTNPVNVIDANDVRITASIVGGARANAFNTFGNAGDAIRLVNATDTVIADTLIRRVSGNGIVITEGSTGTILSGNQFGVRPWGNTLGPFEDSAIAGFGILVTETASSANLIGWPAGNYLANTSRESGHPIKLAADEQLVVNNLIGLPPPQGIASNFSASDYGNGSAVAILVASSDNQLGNNTIGNNAEQIGIQLGMSDANGNLRANSNLVANNRLGIDVDNVDYGLSVGIDIVNGSANTIRENVIANNQGGVVTHSGTSGTVLMRNRILDNSNDGMLLRGSAQVGGETFEDANVIGGNTRGVLVLGSTAPITLKRNYIGTDADAADLGNGTGIQVQNNQATVNIGQPASGNVIGNNSGSGIWLASGASNVWVQSNWIGVHQDGSAIGNARGIRVSGSQDAFENIIGYRANDVIAPLPFFSSAVAGTRGNMIANNGSQGVWVTGSDGAILNTIRGNRFFGNGGRDIDLGMDAIDSGGNANGPNTLLNWPELSSLTSLDTETGQASVSLRVRTSTSNAEYPLLIDLYLRDPAMPARSTLIRSFEYPATSAGSAQTIAFDWPAGLPFSGELFATATDGVATALGNTSQFSPAYPIGPGSGSLSTTTPNNGSGGVFMNIGASDRQIRITGFDLPFAGTAGGTVDVQVFMREGGYEGEELNPASWVLRETITYERPRPNGFSAGELVTPIELGAGQQVAIYLQALSSEGIRYTGNGEAPQTAWSNDDLSLFSDVVTTASTPFGGPLFSPRSFSGVVRYQVMLPDRLFNDRFEDSP